MSNLIWKNIDSKNIPGLMITELPPITKAKIRANIVEIDGRDGDIVEELGYESYIKSVSVGLTNDYNIDQIVKYFTGSGDLILSNEPDKIYKCKIINQVDYERLLKFKTATVKFHTQPFKYLYNEVLYELLVNEEIELEVLNRGLEKSKPLIKLYGSGTINLYINGNQVLSYTFPTDDSEVTIDSIEENAYKDGVYKNNNMIGSFPILEPGVNAISWSGSLTMIVVEPKSRWI